MQPVRGIASGVFAGVNHHAIRYQSSEKEWRQNVPRLYACDADCRKESRRRKGRQGIKENKCGSCKWRFRHLASNITQVLILAASDQSGRNFRDVDAENVSAEGGTG